MEDMPDLIDKNGCLFSADQRPMVSLMSCDFDGDEGNVHQMVPIAEEDQPDKIHVGKIKELTGGHLHHISLSLSYKKELLLVKKIPF